MSSREVVDNPPFRSMVRANGQSEVWTNTTDRYKMQEYGWKCGTNQDAYELETLMGNWCEEWKDLEWLKKAERLPSQFGHYYDSVYNSSYNTNPKSTVPEVLKNLHGRHPHSYPHHQPELDSEQLKKIYNSWKTTYRVDYLDPRFRYRPITFLDLPNADGTFPQGDSSEPVAHLDRSNTDNSPPQGSNQQPNTNGADSRPTQLPGFSKQQPITLWNQPNTTQEDWLHPGFRQQPVDFWNRPTPSKLEPIAFQARPKTSSASRL